MDLIVIAKEPRPGRVKTRLCPPCSPESAAALAEAALADTLTAATGAGTDRVLLALDGRPGEWCPPGVTVVDQGRGGLDARLTRAWTHASGPALLIGMDTPQITAKDLGAALSLLMTAGVDAVLGPATDGGWWAAGLRRPHPRAFSGVPMSRPDTGRRQAERLRVLGLGVTHLPTRTDVDTWPDALAVAAENPATGFAAAVERVARELEAVR